MKTENGQIEHSMRSIDKSELKSEKAMLSGRQTFSEKNESTSRFSVNQIIISESESLISIRPHDSSSICEQRRNEDESKTFSSLFQNNFSTMPTIFFDIETVLDAKRVNEFFKNDDSERVLEFEWYSLPNVWLDTIQDKFWENFNFMPEFHSILTICFWVIEHDWNIATSHLIWTEKEMIEQFFALTEYTDWRKILPNTLCWFNIKSFDIPFIVKRALAHWIKIPHYFKLFWKKPWDMENFLDLYEVYKHTWFKACSLDTLCKFLDIPTPKRWWIAGSQVQQYHDEWRDWEIVTYCMNDVEATARVYQRFTELNLI